MTQLGSLTSTVANATKPILLEQALSEFTTTTPPLHDVLNKGAQYCNAFKARFPEMAVIQENRPGIIKALFNTASYFFHALTAPLDTLSDDPPTSNELFASLLSEGRTELKQLNIKLNHLEDLLPIPNPANEDSIFKDIRTIREQQFVLDACHPTHAQGVDAATDWSTNIEKQAQAADRLIEKIHAQTKAQAAQMSNAAESASLRDMTSTKLEKPVTEEIFAALIADQIGPNTKIELPSLKTFTETLKTLAARSNENDVASAASDIETFESFLQPFRAQINRYPLQRFISTGCEYDELITPTLNRLQSEITSRLDKLDNDTRPYFVLPITSEFMSNLAKDLLDKISQANNLFATKTDSFCQIEKSKSINKYNLKFYQNPNIPTNPPEELTPPYLMFEDIDRNKLLNLPFLTKLLELSVSVPKLETLQPLSFWNLIIMRDFTSIKRRVLDMNKSMEALLLMQQHVLVEDLLTEQFGTAHVPKEVISRKGHLGNNPWNLWETLLISEGSNAFLFDFKLASLVHLSHLQKNSSAETEILLNLIQKGISSLNHELNENASFSKEKFLYARALLDEVKIRLQLRTKTFENELAKHIEPVNINPIFDSFQKEIKLPDMQPAVIAPIDTPSANLQVIKDFQTWSPTPVPQAIQTISDFAASLDNEYAKDNYNGIILSTKAFFRRFNLVNLDEAFWQTLSPTQAESLFLSLEKISTSYFKSYFDADVPKLPDAESGLLMMETLILSERVMSKLGDATKLNDQQLPLSDLYPYVFNRGAFFRFGDPVLDHRLEALQRYCTNRLRPEPAFSGSLGGLTERPLFTTNLAPIKQQTLGFLLGDAMISPSIFIIGGKISLPADKNRPPLDADDLIIDEEAQLQSYLKQFINTYDARHPEDQNLPKIDKCIKMLTQEVDDVLPKAFYAARRIPFNTQYFFRGSFIKPSNFRKNKQSYKVTFETVDPMNEVSPVTNAMVKGMSKTLGSDVRFLHLSAKIDGIDATIFQENPEIADGQSSAHQFSHLERPPVDPIIQNLQNRHLQKSKASESFWDIAKDFFNLSAKPEDLGEKLFSAASPFNIFQPGITEAGRNIYDLNVVMVQPNQELKKYLTKQEYEQLASLKTEPQVQIANTLSFFRNKSELLQKPDMQSYLTNLIFDPPLLLNELQMPKRGIELEKQLAEFVGSEYALNERMGNLDTAEFYLGLGSRLRQYCLFARQTHPKIYSSASPLPEFFNTFPDFLNKAIDRASDASKGLLHGLAAQQSMSENSLDTPEKVSDFLRHAILYHRFPPSGKTLDPLLQADIKRLLVRFAPDVLKVQKDASFFENILKEAYPELPKDAEMIQAPENPFFYTLKDRPVTVDLTKGVLLAPGIDGVPMPANGLNSPVYTSLYGTREFRAKTINLSTFEFTDHLGQLNRLIRLPDKTFVIQRKFDRRGRKWYQYVPPNVLLGSTATSSDTFENLVKTTLNLSHTNFEFLLPAQPLIEGHTHWYSDASPGEMLILNQKGQSVYRVELSGSEILTAPNAPKILTKLHSLTPDGKDHLELVNLQGISHPFSWAAQFEDPEQTLVWKDYDRKEPQRIEFPRVGAEGLSFTKDGSIFKSDQFTGYFLKKDQINPLGINCKNFLLLENKKGEQKLILAGQSILSSEESTLSSLLTFKRDAKTLGKKVPFFVYDQGNGDQAFSSQDIGANFYLAMIHGAHQRYKPAMKLLRQFGRGSAPFTTEEKEILKWISKLDATLHHSSPQLTALRALAQVTLKRNTQNPSTDSQQTLTPEANNLQNIASDYFKAAKDLGLFRLDLEEEFFLLQHGLFQGQDIPVLQLFHSLMQNNPEKARDAILMLSSGMSKNLSFVVNDELLTLLQGLQDPSQAFKPTAPLESLPIEAIIQDPFAYVKDIGTNKNNPIADDLKALFKNQGASKLEKEAFEFYYQDSLIFLKNKDQAEYRLKDLNALKAKRIEITETHRYMQKALTAVELSILRLASKLPEDPVEKARRSSRLEGNAEAPIEMNDLILLYMTHNLSALKIKNPVLSAEEIVQLDRWIDLYLDLTIQNEQRKRVAERILDVEQFSSLNLETAVGLSKEMQDFESESVAEGTDHSQMGKAVLEQSDCGSKGCVYLPDPIAVSRLKEDDPTLKLAIQSFVTEAQVKRQYDPKQNRFLKVFEYHNGFYYRKNQIDKLKNLGISLDAGAETQLMESLVLEMMVGAGKTTYLLPTKGFWSADGTHLSMAVMPESLIGNMSREVERIMGKTFSQKVKRFQFTRNTPLTPDHLNGILQMLKDVIAKKEYLITTDKSLKAFLNKFAEVFYQALSSKQPEMLEKAELMRQILKVFKEQAEVLFDEADLILDPRRELNFPAGEAIPLPDSFSAISLKLYQFLISPDILNIASFDFAPSAAPAVTPKVFEEQVKPSLVEKILRYLSDNDQDAAFEKLRAFYKNCNSEEKGLLKDYFLGKDTAHQADSWIQTLDDKELRDQVGLIRGQLNLLLPLTLQKNYGERYGFHTEESIIADPFSGSNAPNIGSQFSDPFERIDYTIQAYLKEEGMRRPIIEQLVHELQKRALKELKDNADTIKKLPLNASYRTQAEIELEKYFGQRKNLHLFHPQLVDLLTEIVKNEPATKFDLLEKYVLPQIKVYAQNLKATSQSIGFLFDHAKGFTGTLWNKGTYHNTFKTQFDQGARGQIVTLAYTQAKGKVATIKIQNKDKLPEELIINNPKYKHVKALIDAGGALREFNVEHTAKLWLDRLIQEKSPIQGVVYFNKKDQAMIWEQGESSPIPLSKSTLSPDKRITIYDQKHTTGTDIQQAIDAVALVTVSKAMIMRDFIQAVGRMRKLANGQTINIAVLEEDAGIIREQLSLDPQADLTVEDIMRFLILNEVRRQSEDNQVATTHKLTAIIQEWFLDKVRTNTINEISKDLTHPEFFKQLFFQTSAVSPFMNYGQGIDLVDAKSAYTDKVTHILKGLGGESIFTGDAFLNKGFQDVQRRMNEAVNKADLPETVRKANFVVDQEEEQEIEQEQQQQQQQEQQQQQQQQEELQNKYSNLTPWRHSIWRELSAATVELADIYQPTPTSSLHPQTTAHFQQANNVMLSPLFDDSFLLSHNFQLNHAVFQGNPVQPFGEFQKSIQNIMIIQNEKSQQFTLIAIEPYDAAMFKAALQKKQSLPSSLKDPDFRHHLSDNNKDHFSHKNHWNCVNPTFVPNLFSSCRMDEILSTRTQRSQTTDRVKVWIGDLDLHSLYESDPPIDRALLEKNEQVRRLLVQAKYFNGEVHYPENERKVLKQWLSERCNSNGGLWAALVGGKPDPKKAAELEANFMKTIAAFKEQSKRAYSTSALKQIFQELKEG